jgi:hypothetical protein
VTSSPFRERRNKLIGIYYLGALALIAVGAGLWSTGHGTGDPYLSLGVVLALAPVVVSWLRRRFSRR